MSRSDKMLLSVLETVFDAIIDTRIAPKTSENRIPMEHYTLFVLRFPRPFRCETMHTHTCPRLVSVHHAGAGASLVLLKISG